MKKPRTATILTIGRRPTGTPALAVSARRLRLRRRMTVEDAFRVTVLECLAHVSANVAPVVQNRDVEGLHQLRVGLRRLHVALSAFGDEFRTTALKNLRARAKVFADAVAPARDLDVFVEELLAPIAGRFGHQAFTVLRARAEQARTAAWDAAVTQVASADFAVFRDEVAAAKLCSRFDAAGVVDLKALVAMRAPVGPAAARVLDSHLQRVRKRGRRLKSLEQRRCHRLRIALKRLRHAIEFYGRLYGKKRVGRYLGRLKKLQDLLGVLNDAHQVRTVLGLLIADATAAPQAQADLNFAAGLIDGWYRARAEKLSRKAMKRWTKFKRTEPFWT